MNSMKPAAIAVLLCAATGAFAQDAGDTDAKMPLAESSVTLTLPPATARTLYVMDTMFPAAQASKTIVVDGDKGKWEGMFNEGYWPNLGASPDGSLLYSADTYFEKHTRGKRSDYLVVRDARTLDVLNDIPLPNGRLLIVSKKYNLGITPDGRYALSYNLAPRTAVSVVDLQKREYVGDIDIPGCGSVFPQAPMSFTTLCSDGSVATVTFDAALHATTGRLKNAFDADKDPVFEHSGWDQHGQKLYLIAYSGNVIPLDLSAATPVKQEGWSLTTPAERKDGWKPGGWQLSHFHVASKRLFVLMHRGHEWTHKNRGTEVWVFDAQTHQRLQRIALVQSAQSIAVSQDASPLLYTLPDGTEQAPELITYDVSTGKLRYRMANLGLTPQLLYVPGE